MVDAEKMTSSTLVVTARHRTTLQIEFRGVRWRGGGAPAANPDTVLDALLLKADRCFDSLWRVGCSS